MPTIGDHAPAFQLKDHNGNSFSIESCRGKKIVLFFYPADDTPACTKEVCSLRDGQALLADKNAVLIGISPDNQTSHRDFRQKYGLPFTLLSDPDHNVMLAYDAWGEKNLYGKKVIGVKRSTYVIDENGIIIAAIKRVITDRHAQQIAKFL